MDYAWLRERMQARYGIEKSDFVLVYIGRFGAEKSIGDLLMLLSWALMEQPHTKLLLVGDGPEREHLSVSGLAATSQYRCCEHRPRLPAKCRDQRLRVGRCELPVGIHALQLLMGAFFDELLRVGRDFFLSTISLGTVMEDLPITFGKLHGGLNENAGENTGVRIDSRMTDPADKQAHLGNRTPFSTGQAFQVFRRDKKTSQMHSLEAIHQARPSCLISHSAVRRALDDYFSFLMPISSLHRLHF